GGETGLVVREPGTVHAGRSRRLPRWPNRVHSGRFRSPLSWRAMHETCSWFLAGESVSGLGFRRALNRFPPFARLVAQSVKQPVLFAREKFSFGYLTP